MEDTAVVVPNFSRCIIVTGSAKILHFEWSSILSIIMHKYNFTALNIGNINGCITKCELTNGIIVCTVDAHT